ncbi:MAG: hypothetical protein HZB70_00435 [Candidatus Berkelbacteria bacterium]|nr:MAG: hypothetical protein HZB70_00435 [Candidatus Berkelbacteria bacterium]QQG51426.1 MAG: hypothetical protein HY845_02565 [Candidatus Berkelbacteria bacterium]
MQREGERFELRTSNESFSPGEVKPVVSEAKPPEAVSGYVPAEVGPAPRSVEYKDGPEPTVNTEAVTPFLENEIDANIAVASLSDLEDRVGQVMDTGA